MFQKTGLDTQGFADSVWDCNCDDRRLHTGFVFKLDSSCIFWESRKQKTMAISCAEAEYMALTKSVKEALYLKNILLAKGFSKEDPVKI